MLKRMRAGIPIGHSLKQILTVFVLLLMTVGIVLSVPQLKVVRDFFSKASGTPANLIIDTQLVLGLMPRPWRNFAQGGEDYAWRLAPLNQPMQALHPEYIRLDHIYDFYQIVQGSPGNLSFDFSKFDAVINDIVAVGAKPYIALSYMPPVISNSDIIDQPKNWADWQLTVLKTIEHVSGTLGIRDVYYEVWNEPDLFGGWKYYGNKNYLTLYTYAAMGAKVAQQNPQVLPFKLGGPATTALYKNWFDALAKHVIANNLKFDFFSWHRYSPSLEQYQKDMAEVRSWVEAYPQLMPILEFHITEWGHDSNNHPGYDNNYAAAHTVAGAIAMIPTVQRAFVFEIQDGKGPENQAMWGRWGMFTHQDHGAKPKARYQALLMLDKIADQRLQVLGQGSWVKALAARNPAGQTEIVLANFDETNGHDENVPVTFTNIEPGSYSLNLQYLDGRQQNIPLATSEAVLQTYIMMPVNSVAFGTLMKK